MSLLNTAQYKAAWDSIVQHYRVTIYIQDTAGNWVDFSDRTESRGKNLLKSVGTIALVSDKREGTGATSSKPITIRLDNSDRFFNQPFPSTLKTIDGAAAVFAKSENEKHSVLYNRAVQLRVSIAFNDGTSEEGELSEYIAGKLTRSKNSPFVSLELKDKSLPLRESDSAARLKDGLSWFANKPIPFLLEEALKLRYRQSGGDLPGTFVIPDKVEIESAGSLAGDAGDNRVVSHFGRQPEQDSVTGAWLRKGLFTGAHVIGPSPGNLSSLPSPPPASPTLNILWQGHDDELWYWDAATEKSTFVGTTAGFKIRRLWYSTHQQKIYGVAYKIYTTDPIADVNRHADGNVRVFKYDGTTLSFIKDLTDVYVCEFCYRDGRIVSTNSNIGQVSGFTTGENVPVFYPHKIIDNAFQIFTKPGYGFEKVEKIDTAGTPTIAGYTPSTLDEGYYVLRALQFSGIAHLRFSLGQQGFFVFNSQAVNDIYLWYAKYNDATEVTEIWRIDLQSGSETLLNSDFKISAGLRIDPLCGCPDAGSSVVYVGGIYWDDSSGLVTSQAVIYKIFATGVTTKLYNATDYSAAQKYFTPLEMINSAATGDLIVNMFARDRLGKPDAFILATHTTSTPASDVTVLKERRNQLKGFAASKGPNEPNFIFAYEVGTGKGYRIDADDPENIFVFDDGFSFVGNEFGLAVPELAVDGDTRTGNSSNIVYGVSSPVTLPLEAYEAIPAGKYLLFKADLFYSGRVPLAKTEGMSIWRFIELMKMMSGYRAGFNRGGDFYFVKDTPSTTADYELRLDAVNKRIFDIVVESGEGDVFNFVQLVPHSVFLSPPEWELRLVSREQINEGNETQTALDEKPFDADVLIQQKDDLTKTLRLECVRGGLLTSGKVALRYRSIDERFETRLIASYTAGATTAQISSGIDSVRAGDTFKIEESGNTETVEIAKTPTSAERETGTVTFASGLSNSYAIGAFVEITNNLSEWSDERENLLKDGSFQNWTDVNELVDWTESDANIDAEKATTVGKYLYGKSSAELLLTGGSDSYIYVDIAVSTLAAATNYTVTGFLRSNRGGTSENDTDEMELKVTGATAIEATVSDSTDSFDFDKVSVTFKTKTAPTGNVRVEIHVKGTATTRGWADGFVMKAGCSAELDVIFASTQTFMPIGNSNVEFKFEIQATETKMLVGDQLIIRCPGLDLKKEEASKQTAINTKSRSRYGEIPFPEIDNPFLSPGLARDIARRILQAHAFPRYNIRVPAPLLPYIDFINSQNKPTTITVIDEDTFKKSSEWQEKCKVVGIEDNIGNGRSVFRLKGLEEE